MPVQARTEFAAALNQIASEKGVDVTIVIDAIETAALAAFRKDLSLRGEIVPEEDDTNYTAKIDPVSGEISILEGNKNVTPPGFARIAAQTAKQVIMQKLYEAEKGAMLEEYEKKVGSVISCTMSRQEGNNWFVDLGRAEGIMPQMEQTRDEYYHQGQRLKVYIKEIREGRRGPEVVVSRSDPQFVKGLFAMEVPEIQSGSVEIKTIAREAGGRTKLAAISTQDGVDPVGSLVGQKGVRVQAVMQELGEEKIDIISYSDEPTRFIASALSPAKEVEVTITDMDAKIAKVKVADSQLSLAIGRGGQNVRLAAKLTGFKIDIEGMGGPGVSAGTDKSDKSEDGESVKSEEAVLTEEAGTEEKKEDAAAVPSDDNTVVPAIGEEAEAKEEVQHMVEENIDQAVEEEAGTTQPEPTPEEAAPAVEAAVEDMTEEASKDGDK